ncbi:hypothetical protein SLS62_000105 [Diatrype stigma]|uniref:DUF7905 domain-containing protein n=1 Tax=Diatrype stigma TaxID=117547 RepID=A0AAN9YWZ8_9PEZI
MPSASRQGSDAFGSNSETINYDYDEFLFSTGWLLRPKGLQELFEELEKSVVKHEVTFDVEDGMFKIRCSREEEEGIVKLTTQAIERIIKTNSDSEKALAMNVWDESKITPGELREIEFFQAPRSITDCLHKSKWEMPRNNEFEQFTILDLLPSNSFSIIKRSTDTTLALFNGALSTWIGADTEDKVALVKKRFDTLVTYFGELQQARKSEHFFNAEEFRDWKAEFRYLNHVNTYILPSFFLDRDIHESTDYARMFARGATIRISFQSLKKGTSTPAAQSDIIPATSGQRTNESFRGFQDWKYCGRARECIPKRDSSTPTSQEQPNFDIISSWVNRLPESQTTPEFVGDQQPAQEPGRDTEHVSVSHTGSEGHDPPDSLSTTAANVDNVPETSTAEVTSETKDLEIQEEFAEEHQEEPEEHQEEPQEEPQEEHPEEHPEEHQMPVRAELVGRTPTSDKSDDLTGDRTQDQANDTLSDQKSRDDSENHSLSMSRASSLDLPANNLDIGLEDPFRSLWLGVRPTFTAGNRLAGNLFMRTAREGSAATESQTPSSASNGLDLIDLEEPTYEKNSRQYHNTMLQKAGSRPGKANDRPKSPNVPRATASRSNLTQAKPRKALAQSKPQESTGPTKPSNKKDLDPELLSDLTESLAKVLKPLKIFPGKLSLKAQIGRFCFTKVNKDLIQLPNPGAPVQNQDPYSLKRLLDLHHVGPKGLWFTRMLTTHGGDANHIAWLKESDGTRMWSPDPTGRRSVYQFPCAARGADDQVLFCFTLEVDSSDFSYRILHIDEKPHRLFVHCLKRSWDFQLELSTTQDLEKTCESFARDLVDSLCVTTQESGVPRLAFKIKRGHRVDIGIVRIRNTATYYRQKAPGISVSDVNQRGNSMLEISEIHDMETRFDDRGEEFETYSSESFPGNRSKGHPSMWFEASIQSTAFSSAFRENEVLELGDETTWSPEALCNAGALENLIRAANDTVKQMDGVGYWCDNNQDPTAHGRPAGSAQSMADLEHRRPGVYKDIYW